MKKSISRIIGVIMLIVAIAVSYTHLDVYKRQLQGMATNTSYFTSAEQGLMNATTVTTKDTKNSSVTYTLSLIHI